MSKPKYNNEDKLKIFYIHSTRNEMVYKTYLELYDKLSDIAHISDPDDSNGSLSDNILNQIENADIIICDITPDFHHKELIEGGSQFVGDKFVKTDDTEKDVYTFNEHVMFELGYASGFHNEENIIMLYNEKQFNTDSSILPIFIKTKKYDSYGYESHEDIENIVDKVDITMKNYKEEQQAISHDYHYNQLAFYQLSKIIEDVTKDKIVKIRTKIYPDTNAIKSLIITSKKKVVGEINVTSKMLIVYGEKGALDLCHYKDLYDNLKHMEIVLMLHHST